MEFSMSWWICCMTSAGGIVRSTLCYLGRIVLIRMSREPEVFQRHMLNTEHLFQPIFKNESPRCQTESQCISQFGILLAKCPGMATKLLCDGISEYLCGVIAIADAKITMDILKLLLNLSKICPCYWITNQKAYNKVLQSLKNLHSRADSILVTEQALSVLNEYISIAANSGKQKTGQLISRE